MGVGPSFPSEWNDGTRNRPEAGDHIITDARTWTGYYYGTGQTDPAPTENPGQDPATGRDYIWFLDSETGTWEVGGQTVTVFRNDASASGILDLKYRERIGLDGIPKDYRAHAFVVWDGGRVELELDGDDGMTIERHIPEETKIPYKNIRLVVEFERQGETEPADPNVPDDPNGPGDPNAPVDPTDAIRKWQVDLGDGTWQIDSAGEPVTAVVDGKPASGILELEEHTPIKLENLDQDTMRVCAYGDAGFHITLIINGDHEVSVGRYEESVDGLPDALRIMVERRPEETNDAPGEPEPTGKEVPSADGSEGNNTPSDREADPIAVPADRHSDFDILPAAKENAPARSSAKVETARMTAEEQKYYEALTDEKLGTIAENVKKIVETADPGRAETAAEQVLEELSKKNGLGAAEGEKLFPIAFEGHQDIGFPVRVTVPLAKGTLRGGGDLYVYHQKADATIEALGKAEYLTYEDGSIQELSFYTTGFSTFFTSAKQLDISGYEQRAESVKDDFPLLLIVIPVCVLGIAAVVILLLLRKKKSARG